MSEQPSKLDARTALVSRGLIPPMIEIDSLLNSGVPASEIEPGERPADD